MARKIPREFVPLDLQLPRDPAIRRAGPTAELLFIRGLIYLKASNSDGFIPEFDLPVVGVGIPATAKAAGALVDAGLWQPSPGGWLCRSWLKWNLSEAEKVEEREQRKLGALKSNHKQGRHADSAMPDCPMCKAVA